MKKILSIVLMCGVCISSLFAVDLRLTEVFIDGSDERVEIANIDSLPFV
jgi:hypothetical protein